MKGNRIVHNYVLGGNVPTLLRYRYYDHREYWFLVLGHPVYIALTFLLPAVDFATVLSGTCHDGSHLCTCLQF
jgi:hypothetical protein